MVEVETETMTFVSCNVSMNVVFSNATNGMRNLAVFKEGLWVFYVTFMTLSAHLSI